MNKIKSELVEYWKIMICAIVPIVKFPSRFKQNIKTPFYQSMSKSQSACFVFCNLFLSVYITFVIYISHSPSLFHGKTRTIIVFTTSLFLFFIIYNLIIYCCYKFKNNGILINYSKSSIRKTTVFIFAGLCLAILTLSLLANFPGGISPDTENQWAQVQNFKFNDWHPVIHTLLIWTASRVINHYAFVVFLQITIFSIGAGYLIATLESWGFSKKQLLFLGAYIVLNPYTINIMMYPWKDLALTILLTYTTIMLINIYFTEGKWFSKIRNILLFAVTTGLAAMVRHNGIFFVIPLYIVVILFYIKKAPQIIIAVLASAFIIFAVKVPLYSALKVEYPHNVYKESVGIPMTILGDTLIKNPDRLSPETKEFLYKIASDEEWRKTYTPGDYNSIKFNSKASYVVETVPPEQFIKMVLQTSMAAKHTAFHAFCDITEIVWRIDNHIVIVDVPHSLGEGHLINRILNFGFRGYTFLILSIPIISSLCTSVGLLMFLLLLSGVFSLYKNGASILLLVVPPVMYNLGTMLLLAGGDIRFFHFNVVITLPLIFVLLAKKIEQKAIS